MSGKFVTKGLYSISRSEARFFAVTDLRMSGKR
jgi:hypothetical protein